MTQFVVWEVRGDEGLEGVSACAFTRMAGAVAGSSLCGLGLDRRSTSQRPWRPVVGEGWRRDA